MDALRKNGCAEQQGLMEGAAIFWHRYLEQMSQAKQDLTILQDLGREEVNIVR